VLQVGATPTKNIERTAEALAGLSCHLDIIGRLSASQKQALKRFGINYSNSFQLSDSEVLAKYEQSDVVIFPSLLEGFGMPIVEGNAVGRPVITSNVSSMPEVAGDAACLVDPLSVASIRAGFLRVVEDSSFRSGLIESGFKNAQRFSARTIASQYCSLYEEVGLAVAI
jgi:glycosyltransferase involved in cell wall biosynthesis